AGAVANPHTAPGVRDDDAVGDHAVVRAALDRDPLLHGVHHREAVDDHPGTAGDAEAELEATGIDQYVAGGVARSTPVAIGQEAHDLSGSAVPDRGNAALGIPPGPDHDRVPSPGQARRPADRGEGGRGTAPVLGVVA